MNPKLIDCDVIIVTILVSFVRFFENFDIIKSAIAFEID